MRKQRHHLNPQERADLIDALRLRAKLTDKELMRRFDISRTVITNAQKEARSEERKLLPKLFHANPNRTQDALKTRRAPVTPEEIEAIARGLS